MNEKVHEPIEVLPAIVLKAKIEKNNKYFIMSCSTYFLKEKFTLINNWLAYDRVYFS